jgi:hypothetical protein
MNKQKEMMKTCLEIRGYHVTEEKLNELWDIYEECHIWSGEEMVTGKSYDEIEDFIKHSRAVDEIFDEDSEENTVGSIKLIPDWQNRNIRCYFCGSSKSVKYEKRIFDPVLDDTKPSTVYVCNRCALLRSGSGKGK